jgi:hypothetical protein
MALVATSPFLDSRTLSAVLALTHGSWGSRTLCVAASSFTLTLHEWEELLGALGLARLQRVLHALRESVGYAAMRELNRPVSRGPPPHVSATLWLMTL